MKFYTVTTMTVYEGWTTRKTETHLVPARSAQDAEFIISDLPRYNGELIKEQLYSVVVSQD